jgi:acetolactate synthase-1/2/3 large subunit
MEVASVVANILKQEGVEFLTGFPVNPLIDAAAQIGIRPIIVRQERTAVHMADAFSRISSGKRIGVCVTQYGPGAENAFGGIAQAYGDSVPVVILPTGYPRSLTGLPPNFSALFNYRHITKWLEQVTIPSEVPNALRRAFTQVRNGRPRPVVVELPTDLLRETVSDGFEYTPTFAARTAPDPGAVAEAARLLSEAKHPVIYAGQGIHYAEAWQALRDLAELLAAPVATSLPGKSAFPENHPLALGTGGRAVPEAVFRSLQDADVILGIGCSFAKTSYNVSIPPHKTVIHATLDPADLNKDVPASYALIGDAKLTLEELLTELADRPQTAWRDREPRMAAEIGAVKSRWLAQWMPKLKSEAVPLSPYRVIWDLMHTVDRRNTIITHDAGGPRDQLSPFWETLEPLTYVGWGKTTQLGSSLGFAMGAKLAQPEKLCIAYMGDAAIGMTGMDFETAVRERIPVLVVLSKNSSMACELPIMQVSTEMYGCTDLSGDYADLARSLGGHGERVTQPVEIIPAIERGIELTAKGTPVLLEFITSKETEYSSFSS